MSVCARCGATFTCSMADGDGSEPCWCASLPLVMPVPAPGSPASASAPAEDTSCWCPDCLKRHIATTSAATGAAPAQPE